MATPALKTRVVPNKHRLRTEATRRALLEAARRIFARDGFEASRIEDIAAATGRTRGAFYAQFRNKEDLFFALLEQEAGRQLHQLQGVLERRPNAAGRLEALREFYVHRASDRQWVMLTLEFKLFALRHPHLRAKLVRTHRRIRASLKLETIRSMIPSLLRGGPETRQLRRTALEAVLNGLVLEHAYDPETITEAQVMAVLRQFFDVLMAAR
jgi:AcrR family transcriptional regulator